MNSEHPDKQSIRSNSIAEGQRLARKVFAKRGNHSEAHMSELELAALLTIAVERGQFLERQHGIHGRYAELIAESDRRTAACRKPLNPNSPSHLSVAAQRVLARMLKAEQVEQFDDAELVCDGRQCWVGLEQTSRAVVNELLREALIRDTSDVGKGAERYTLNEDGRRAAVDPGYKVPELYGRGRR